MAGRFQAVAILALAMGLGACDREHQPDSPPPRIKQVFHLNAYEKDFGYSQAVQIDKTLYVSGSMAADANGRPGRSRRHGGADAGCL